MSSDSFVQDLDRYHTETKHYYDLSGCAKIEYYTADIDMIVYEKNREHKSWEIHKPFLDISGVSLSGYSNPNEIVGASIDDELKWSTIKGDYLKKYDFSPHTHMGLSRNNEDILLRGELIAPLLEEIEEKGEEEETSWFCKGCSKYFATKASLKRHHERKKVCKELTETPVQSMPEKPYIVDWVDELLKKSISGDSDKSYCKHCEIEFANKSNLNKHMSKSVACDKLAKQDFLKSVKAMVAV